MPPRKRKAQSQPRVANYEQQYKTCTCEELRQKLEELGESPGPIDESNRAIYIRLLIRKRMKVDSQEVPHSTSPPSAGPSTTAVHSSPPSLSRPPLRNTPSLLSGNPSTPKKVASASKMVPSNHASQKARAETQAKISKFTVTGLTAATFTPFTSSGDVNLPVIAQYADWLCQSGVYNVFVNGTTGESLSLTVGERKLITEHWLRESAGRLTVIVHAGCESLRDTCELAQHAERSGAAAIGVMPTTYFKPASIDHLIQYLSVVAEAAPTLPLFYYHIPSMTGVHFNMKDFLDAASSRLLTLRGMKFTSLDLHQLSQCVVHSGGRYQVLYGMDQQLLGALVMGCTAAIGSTYNYLGKLNNRLLAAFRRNDLEAARLEQRRAQAVVRLLEQYGGHAGVGKELMRLRGVDLGPPRLPILPLPLDQTKTLEAEIRALGFFDWS